MDIEIADLLHAIQSATFQERRALFHALADLPAEPPPSHPDYSDLLLYRTVLHATRLALGLPGMPLDENIPARVLQMAAQNEALRNERDELRKRVADLQRSVEWAQESASDDKIEAKAEVMALEKLLQQLRQGKPGETIESLRAENLKLREKRDELQTEIVRQRKARSELRAQVDAMNKAIEVYARDTEAAQKEAATLRSGYAGYLNILSDICGVLDLPVSYQFAKLPDAVRALKDSGRTDPTR